MALCQFVSRTFVAKGFAVKPVKITIGRIREIEAICGPEVRLFCQQVLISTFDHEDNALAFLAMAQKYGISLDEFCAYAWLQVYLKDMDTFNSKQVAKWFRIPLCELEEYLRDRIEQLYAEQQQDVDLELMSLFGA